MLNFVKLFNNQKWINGELYIKKTDVDEAAKAFLIINDKLGHDVEEVVELVNAASLTVNELAIRIPVMTTEKIWKGLKKSSNIRLIATTEKLVDRVIEPEEQGIVLA